MLPQTDWAIAGYSKENPPPLPALPWCVATRCLGHIWGHF